MSFASPARHWDPAEARGTKAWGPSRGIPSLLRSDLGFGFPFSVVQAGFMAFLAGKTKVGRAGSLTLGFLQTPPLWKGLEP